MTKIIKGHMSYGEPVVRGDISDIHIGKFCSIAQNVIFDCGWHHNVDFTTTFPLNVFYKELNHITSHPKSKGDINIGNDVWIGEGSIIMGGIVIGNGAVIGAGSVVTKNVEPYQVVGGCPAKHIKYRVNNYQREMLEKIKWWDWTDKEIIKKAELIMSSDVEAFIKSCLE